MEEYYKREDLPKFGEIGKEASRMAQKYFEYYNEVFSEGELTLREKSLIALAVAHAIQCPYCMEHFEIEIDYSHSREQEFVHDCDVCCQPIVVSVSDEAVSPSGSTIIPFAMPSASPKPPS